ncbi:MAG TPA: hypothetical protein VFW96_22065 [Thermomicrobiales bacterium]|nr:hypothetical protein [Thermomicrobiales bacterium]
MDKLIVGLTIVDQMDGEKRTRAIAEALMDEAPAPGRWLREAVGWALVARAARLAPEVARPVAAPTPVAGSARS